jgi:hypothetical protein
MKITSKKQGFLAASAIAAMAGVALSIPNAVSAANFATYDFEFKFANNASGIGHITVDKDDASFVSSQSGYYGYDYLEWQQNKWVDFSFAYLGKTYTKSDVIPSSYFFVENFETSSIYHSMFGSFHGFINASTSDGKSFFGNVYSNNHDVYGYIDSIRASSFSLTERKAVPVPAFALGIVAASGWIASKQLRRQTKAIKQEVAV